MSDGKDVPKEYYRLMITKRIYISKTKSYEVRSVFDWEEKEDALAVKALLAKANKPPLDKTPLNTPNVSFKIVHPDEPL
jgi:hypothetical protein